MQTMGGLGNLAQTQTYAPQIAQMTGGVGQTLGQGMIAEQQGLLAGQEDLRNFAQNGMSFLGGGMFSDESLKDNLVKTGIENGFNIYSWTWNELANSLGLHGDSSGVIAQEVEKTRPDAVIDVDGLKTVDYDMIGVKHG